MAVLFFFLVLAIVGFSSVVEQRGGIQPSRPPPNAVGEADKRSFETDESTEET